MENDSEYLIEGQEKNTQLTKKKIVTNLLWNALEKYSTQIIQFIIGVVMARLLTPAEYGVIGIVGVFMGFSDYFIRSGLGYALIQKKNSNSVDFYTVNWCNIIISLICYLVLFISAPIIAKFYNMPLLVPTIRVMAVSLVIGSISNVGRNILTKELKFKKLSIVTVSTTIISGIVGITLAYYGFGIWALVFQTVITTIFSSVCILFVSRFFPRFVFSYRSFRQLWNFGSKLLGSDLIYVIFNNIYPLVIGKGFSSQDVAYYNRANSYSSLIPSNINGVLMSVLFPVFSKIQDNVVQIENYYRKAIVLTTALILVGNCLLIGLAKPLIVVILTDKWIECVALLQILCVGTAIDHINVINSRLLVAKGLSGIFFKTQMITKPINIGIILLSINFGLYGLVWGQVISTLIDTIINCIYFNKYVGINIVAALRKVLPLYLIVGLISTISVILFNTILTASFINALIVGCIMLIILYSFIRLFMPSILVEIKLWRS